MTIVRRVLFWLIRNKLNGYKSTASELEIYELSGEDIIHARAISIFTHAEMQHHMRAAHTSEQSFLDFQKLNRRMGLTLLG